MRCLEDTKPNNFSNIMQDIARSHAVVAYMLEYI